MEQNPHCDICGRGGLLQLHHFALIRHGYPSKIGTCSVLCPQCHCELHDQYDQWLDDLHEANPERDDWKEIYEAIKKSMRSKLKGS